MIKKRLDYIDCAKGIAMLLVIIGHTFLNESVQQLIYSFHMPLFFIASGLTAKYPTKENYKQKTLALAKKFLPLAVILASVVLILRSLVNGKPTELFTVDFWKNFVLSLIWQRGDKADFFGMTINAIGLPWFLFAIVYSRAIYDYVYIATRKFFVLIYVVMFLVGVGATFVVDLPFSLNIVLQIPLYMFIGSLLKDKMNKPNLLLTIIFSVAWLAANLFVITPTHKGSHLGMGNYQEFPICYIVAVLGTIAFLGIGHIVEWFENKTHIKILSFIGRNSIWLFVVHSIDSLWMTPIVKIIPEMVSITRIVTDVFVMCIAFYLWKFIKSKKEEKAK